MGRGGDESGLTYIYMGRRPDGFGAAGAQVHC